MMKHRSQLPVLSNNGRSTSTTPLGRTRSNISSSASVHRINISSPCSNYIFPTRLPLKRIKPEPWQRFFDGEKRQVYTQQGLTVKKNKQQADVIISEEFFSLTDENARPDETAQHGGLPGPIQAHIDSLSEQIDDLTLELAEERLNHRHTRTRAEENLKNQLQHQSKQVQELLHRKMLDHEKEIEEQSEKYSKALSEEKIQSEIREKDLKDELEFVKNSFHSYKINLEKDYAEKLQLHIEEATEGMKKQLQEKEEEMNKKINDIVTKERKNLVARQKMEIDNMRKQNQKELETIHKTYADSAFDRARIETLTKELTETKLELEEAKERIVNLFQQLKDREIQHVETARQLNEFRTRFDEKAKEIEKNYASRIDQLHLQNADLRNIYMKKCAELVEERTLTQQKIAEQVHLTRQKLQRKLLNVRIISAIPLTSDNNPQRLSTCATASQADLSPTRCRSAFAASHPVSTIYNHSTINNNSVTDFCMDNIRRETKLRRRASLPITEEEQDVVRYLTSRSMTPMPYSVSSKYNFESEPEMIKHFSLEDLQETFKS